MRDLVILIPGGTKTLKELIEMVISFIFLIWQNYFHIEGNLKIVVS